MFMYPYMLITYVYIVWLCFMLFAPLINIIFDISTSNNIRISNINAKNSRK